MCNIWAVTIVMRYLVTRGFAYSPDSAGVCVFAPTTTSTHKHLLHRLTTLSLAILFTPSGQHSSNNCKRALCLFTSLCEHLQDPAQGTEAGVGQGSRRVGE